LICEGFSYEVICKKCQKNFLTPTLRFTNGVYSFYDYDEIEFLIKYKYHRFGNRVFKILALNSFKLLKLQTSFCAIPIDDRPKRGYSHTAILAKYSPFKPLFSSLHAKNDVEYAGKSLEFRLKNPRDFIYRGKKNIDVVLIDDVTTTGSTLKQAEECLKKNGVNVVFSVVLADLKA